MRVSKKLKRLMWLLVLVAPIGFGYLSGLLHGPYWGSVEAEHAADLPDAVAWLYCRGPGLHGDIRTDEKAARVDAEGHYFIGTSLQFPSTEQCYVEVRHPRYQKTRVTLSPWVVQRAPTVKLESWATVFAGGPPDQGPNATTRSTWPLPQLSRHLADTAKWLSTFTPEQQMQMRRYVPVIHDIYRQALDSGQLRWPDRRLRQIVNSIGRLEAQTGYEYPFKDYLAALKADDVESVQAHIDGGGLREIWGTDRQRALNVAAGSGSVEVIGLLLRAGEPLGDGCDAALLAAISGRRWTAAIALIDAGADPGVACGDRHPLGDAMLGFARNGNVDLLSRFLDAGVPADAATSSGASALAFAVEAGRIEAAKTLLAAGADPRVSIGDGTKLVDLAAAKGLLDAERLLQQAIERGPAPTVEVEATPGADAAEVGVQTEPFGEVVALPWRRGEPVPVRVHTSHGRILEIVADPKEPGTFWLATYGGLVRMVPRTGERRVWTRVNGLPSSHVRNVFFDDDYLWVSTSGGLARLPLVEMNRVETVGSGKPRSSFASGFVKVTESSVWYWSGKSIYHLRVEEAEAIRIGFDSGLAAVAADPEGSGLIVAQGGSIRRLDPRSGERRLVVETGRLVDAGTAAQQPVRVASLDVDAARGVIWVGLYQHGVARVSLDDGGVERLALTKVQRERCARTKLGRHIDGRVVSAGGTNFVYLEKCFGRIEDGQFIVMRDHIDAGPVEDAAGDLWFIADGAFHHMRSGERFAWSAGPFDNAQVTAVHVAGGKLFAGVDESPLMIMDLESRSWTAHPDIADVRRVREVAGRADLAVLGSGEYWWLNGQTLDSEPLVFRPPMSAPIANAQWRDVRDLEFDGHSFWVLRDNRQRGAKSRVGLYRFSANGTQRFDGVSGYYLGQLAGLAQDSENADRLWLVMKRDYQLVDFDKAQTASVLIGTNERQRGQSRLLTEALQDPRLKALTLRRNQALDPDDPNRIWQAASGGGGGGGGGGGVGRGGRGGGGGRRPPPRG
ncbi:MAG: hypothetical protein O7H39_12260, partial [Gammaproteobacteria bacterium]|nr:hypothetical protein [Gammaproteobacteria bacterium]